MTGLSVVYARRLNAPNAGGIDSITDREKT